MNMLKRLDGYLKNQIHMDMILNHLMQMRMVKYTLLRQKLKLQHLKQILNSLLLRMSLKYPKNIRRVTLYIEYMMQKDYILNSIEQEDVYQIILYQILLLIWRDINIVKGWSSLSSFLQLLQILDPILRAVADYYLKRG